MTSARLSLIPPVARTEVELLYVDDVVRLLGGRKGAWWVRKHFAPKLKLKIGRTVAWPREEALQWIREQRVVQ